MSKKKRRLNIPDHVMLKLWVTSGGRCEFPGCNRLVWRDGLTLKEDNFAHMAHLVAASADGPRGDRVLSKELSQEFSNLMLVCLIHSKLIDGRHKSEFSLEDLRAYKEKHEDRIRVQTSVAPDMGTTVVRFQAKIADRPVSISLSQAYHAIRPRFPENEKGIFLDFTIKPGHGSQSYWKEFQKDILAQVHANLLGGNARDKFEHLSVFALAPIPLLMYFGRTLGNIIPMDVYQKHRNTDNGWDWKKEPKKDIFAYSVRHKRTRSGKRGKIALVLSLSGKVQEKEVLSAFPDTGDIYEVSVPTPNPGFLPFKSRLEKFKPVYRSLLSEIRQRHGEDCEIRIFPAIPAPIAVLCGSELLPKSDPKILIYDNRSGFNPTLRIN